MSHLINAFNPAFQVAFSSFLGRILAIIEDPSFQERVHVADML
jgi:hypothetical protein